MPGWHASTEQLQRQGRLQLVGIVEEQHPDRAQLFMQWQQMDWPVVVDALGLLGVKVVPIAVAIDENGVVRHLRPSPEEIVAFAEQTSPPSVVTTHASMPTTPDIAALEREASAGDSEALGRLGDALFMWGGGMGLDAAITAYEKVLAGAPQDGPTHFRLGTALRRRYDTGAGRADDFARAVRHWAHALEIDPNNYIWRRRIQQFGPRLDKPYPFYGWVAQARRELSDRGMTPVRLVTEPSGAELAEPVRAMTTEGTSGPEPDGAGRVLRDQGLVAAEVTVVPPVIAPGEAVRAHVRLTPRRRAHWNNEADDLVLWVTTDPGWTADRVRHSVRRPAGAVTREPRLVEIELKVPADALPGPASVAAYALYYVCEETGGTCLYRRQDLRIPVTVRSRP